MSEMHYLSATDALRLFCERALSPVELLEAVQARAEQVEASINSLCHVDFDQALMAANEAEARYSGRGPAPRPLEGLPIAIKETEPIQGQPWTRGSLMFRDEIADHTSDVSARILAAGAVVHARTTSPELGAAAFTRSKLWGVTRNPWNLAASAGGSSGGSGAALAAGVTTLASGSDIGGSIRVPASFNGVVGYKPPFGRVPNDPPRNHDTFLHGGPMARSVLDAALLQNVLAGPSDGDINSLRPRYVLPDHFADVSGMRIAVSVDLGSYAVDPEIRQNTLAVAAGLRQAGAVVDEIDLNLSRDEIHRASAIHYRTYGGFRLRDAAASELVSPYIPVMAKRFTEYAGDGTMQDMFELQSRLYAAVAKVFNSYDALITPTMVTRGLNADSDYLGDEVLEIDGEQFVDPLFGMVTVLWNILSQCPVLAVPSGFAQNGVPTGVQIVAPSYQDEVVFRVGTAVEQLTPLYVDADTRPQAV